MQIDFQSLRNGTDVRGTALSDDGGTVNLTREAVTRIGAAFCIFLKNRGLPRPVVAVGHDSRLSADTLVHSVTDGILSEGGDVILTGLSSTPSMFMLLQDDFGASASVMVTASHLPRDKNGLKFFVPEGGLEGSDVQEILTIAAQTPLKEEKNGTVTERSYLARYSAGLVEKVRAQTGKERPLAGKRILVDAGNGAGGFYAELVLKPLGADTTGSQFTKPDGNFPNHIPNPENADAMASVSRAVVENHADFGIIFDTDVDRAGAVAKSGEEINRNRLIALISAILLEEQPGAYIVTDSVTSNGLGEFIRSRGGVHHRFKRGYKNVINEAKRLVREGHVCPLAIETSGHAALAENYFLDDGAYLVTRLLIALAKVSERGETLESLIEDLPEPVEAAEIRLPFLPGCDFKTLGEGVIRDLETAAKASPYLSLAPENHEGVRINFDKEHGDGWALVRMSLHEPILPINAESDSAGGNAHILAELGTLLGKYPFLDTRKLKTI